LVCPLNWWQKDNSLEDYVTTIKIPASIEDAVDHLGSLEQLLVAKDWERAAIVAAFVRLGKQGVSPSKANGGLSTDEFAALGIAGLKSKTTVQTYVKRWLKHTDGIYPEAGAKVLLPEAEWEPTRTGTDGHSTKKGMEDKLEEMAEKHGVEALATAAKKVTKKKRKEKNQDSKKTTKVKEELQEVVDEATEEHQKQSTGYTDPDAQEVRSATKDLVLTRLMADQGANQSPELIDAVTRLEAFAASWRQELTGTGSVTWTEADREMAAQEFGIDLEAIG
jgi:hypothetical protein